MGGKEWSTYETAVIIYFASRNADHEGCSKILWHKCNEARSGFAVRGRLERVRSENRLWTESGWNRAEVDKWLIGLRLPNLATVTSFNMQELNCMKPVNYPHMPSGVTVAKLRQLNRVKFLDAVASDNNYAR